MKPHSLVHGWILCLASVSLLAMDEGGIKITTRESDHVSLSVSPVDHTFSGEYTVNVFLPPNYAKETTAYRVLYGFDGQNLRREHDALLTEGLIHPAILVGIHNRSSDSRFYDLTPTKVADYRVPTGGLVALGKLIVDKIKPYIDAHFRTLPGPDYTGVAGHSLGGLSAFWMAYEHPEIFGFSGCLEPSLWWNDNELLNRLRNETSSKTATRFWIMGADVEDPDMWRNTKRAAFALVKRGWKDGEDVAYYQVPNAPHAWDSCKSQLRDMLHFWLRKAPPRLIGIALTNAQGPQHEPICLRETAEYSNAFLQLNYEGGFRSTAIAPVLKMANPEIVRLEDQELAQLFPGKNGWTLVSTEYEGFKASLAVQGFDLASYEPLPLPRATGPISVDGDLKEWGSLPYEKNDGASAGFQFSVVYDQDFLYIACRVKDDLWVPRSRLSDPINQDGIEIRVDARPDPIRSLGRGQFPFADYTCILMAPGETPETMKLRRLKEGILKLPEGVRAVCVRTTEGFIAEVAIPTAVLAKAQGGPWKDVRINITQYDLDRAEGDPRRISWQPEWKSAGNQVCSGTFSKQ